MLTIASVQPEVQTMYVDLMYVSGLPYLLTVINPLEYVMVHKLYVFTKNENNYINVKIIAAAVRSILTGIISLSETGDGLLQ